MSDKLNIFTENPKEYQERLLNKWLEKGGTSLERSDSRKLLIDLMAYGFALLASNLNYKTRQNFVRYSQGEYLDALGEYKNIKRLGKMAAQTTIRFEISEALENPLPIFPQLISAANNIYFQSEYVEIPKGATCVEATALCTTLGEVGNGYLPGEISKIVSPFAYFKSVCNITESQGGAEEESDANYRTRIISSPEGYSTAGPSEAYKIITKSINQKIMDVEVYSSGLGKVDIVPLLENGEIPEQTIIDEIQSELSTSDKRPLTDLVKVSAPETISYDIDITYYVESTTPLYDIKEKVEELVEEYITWQKGKLGRDINPSELYFKLRDSGIKRVEIASPSFQKLEKYQIALPNLKNINFGGTEDD